jgi:hypothetical protein
VDASEADARVLEHQLQTEEPLAEHERDLCVAFDSENSQQGELRARARALAARLGLPMRTADTKSRSGST